RTSMSTAAPPVLPNETEAPDPRQPCARVRHRAREPAGRGTESHLAGNQAGARIFVLCGEAEPFFRWPILSAAGRRHPRNGCDRPTDDGGRFWQAFPRRRFAGWLIGLMVWLLPGAGLSRPMIIILLT